LCCRCVTWIRKRFHTLWRRYLVWFQERPPPGFFHQVCLLVLTPILNASPVQQAAANHSIVVSSRSFIVDSSLSHTCSFEKHPSTCSSLAALDVFTVHAAPSQINESLPSSDTKRAQQVRQMQPHGQARHEVSHLQATAKGCYSRMRMTSY
jgi:hypothetical protein